LRRSNYDRKKIQSPVRCYAIPITTGKKRYSRLAIIQCAVPIATVAPFQLRPEKKDTVVCLLLCRSKYDRKKKQKSGGYNDSFPGKTPNGCSQVSLIDRRSNYDRKKKIQSSVRCYAIPITTEEKKRYRCLAIIRCAVPIAIVAPFQL
jgi:hypothetical protein